MRKSTPSPRRRIRSSSVASSGEPQRCDNLLSTHSIAGTARSIEYVGNQCTWVAGNDGRVLLYSLPENEIVAEAVPRPNTFCTVLCRVSAKRIWGGFADGFICCYDVSTANMVREFVQHDGAVSCLASSPRSEYVYSGGEDWKVYQWLKDSCTYVRLFSGHSNAVRCVVAYATPKESARPLAEGTQASVEDVYNDEDEREDSPHAKRDEAREEYVISGSDDTTIKIWNPRAPPQIAQNTACIATLRGHTGGVNCMEALPHKRELWSGDTNGVLRVWNLHDIRGSPCVAVLEGQHSAPISSIVCVDSCMWSSGKDGYVVVWDAIEKVVIHRLLPGGRIGHQPISVMQRLYRATHWVIWLGGLDKCIQSIHFLAEGGNANVRALRIDRRSISKQRQIWLHERANELAATVENLEKWNKSLEAQVLELKARLRRATLLGNAPERVSARSATTNRKHSKQRRARSAASDTASQSAAPSRIVAGKLPKSLKEESSKYNAGVSSGKPYSKDIQMWEQQENKTTECISDGQKLLEQMELITSTEVTLQDVSGVDSINRSVFEAYKKEMEQRLMEEGTLRQAMQNELAETAKYRKMWEKEREALREAREQIENLQRNLDGEQRYVNELLQEMAQHTGIQPAKRGDQSLLTPSGCSPIQSRNPCVGYSIYKSIPGNYWDNICRNYSDVLKETLFAELTDLVSRHGTFVDNVAYASTGECLLIEIMVGPTTVEREKMQSCLEAHDFPQTCTLHESMSTPFRSNITAKSTDQSRLFEAKERAETERDEALLVLQEATDELEIMYEYQRKAEERRARIPSLFAAATSPDKNASILSSNSQPGANVPLYVATAEEYEGVLAALKKVEKERDEALLSLRLTQSNVKPVAEKGTSPAVDESHLSHHHSRTEHSQTVSVDDYIKVVAEKNEAEAECKRAQKNLQKTMYELEALRRVLSHVEEGRREASEPADSAEGVMTSCRKALPVTSAIDTRSSSYAPTAGRGARTSGTQTELVGYEISDHGNRERQHSVIHGTSTTSAMEQRARSIEKGNSSQWSTASDHVPLSGQVTVPPTTHGDAFPSNSSRHAVGNNSSSAKLAEQKVYRYRCVLGNAWIPVVNRYKSLVEDVFLMEVYRATTIPPNYVKVMEFSRGGSSIELDIFGLHGCENVDQCLQRHTFTVMDSLMRIIRQGSTTPHESHRSATASSGTCRKDDQAGGWHSESNDARRPMGTLCTDEALMEELHAFRCRRAIANSMRKGEQSLQPHIISNGDIDPRIPVDPLTLKREPVFCVTIDEYRSLQRRLSTTLKPMSSTRLKAEGDEPTRLWNEHVVQQAEMERQFARKLNQLQPQYSRSGDKE